METALIELVLRLSMYGLTAAYYGVSAALAVLRWRREQSTAARPTHDARDTRKRFPDTGEFSPIPGFSPLALESSARRPVARSTESSQ